MSFGQYFQVILKDSQNYMSQHTLSVRNCMNAINLMTCRKTLLKILKRRAQVCCMAVVGLKPPARYLVNNNARPTDDTDDDDDDADNDDDDAN